MEKSVMLVGVDDSECSYYALEWTLQTFFSSPENSFFKLVIVHAQPHPVTVVAFAGPGMCAADVVPQEESGVRKITYTVGEKAKEMCIAKSMKDVEVEAMEGDPRNVLCEAVEKYGASVLVVGSHGYGAIKRAVLGSVSDYCAHHAHCSVMIVKKPKH